MISSDITHADTAMKNALHHGVLSAVQSAYPDWFKIAVRGATGVSPTRLAVKHALDYDALDCLTWLLKQQTHILEERKKLAYIWGGFAQTDRWMRDDCSWVDMDGEEHRNKVASMADVRVGRKVGQILIEHGIRPDAFDGYSRLNRGEHPLLSAIRRRGDNLVCLLLEFDFDLTAFQGASGIIAHAGAKGSLAEQLRAAEARFVRNRLAEAVKQHNEPLADCIPASRRLRM